MYPAGITRQELAEQDISDAVILQQDVMPTPWSEQAFLSSIRAGSGCYKLVKESELIAVAVVTQVLDEAELLTLAVTKQEQGNGLGGFFLKDLLAILKSQAAAQCMLEVMDGNKSAIAVYSSAGFQHIGIRKNYYRTADGTFNALVMRLNY
jgi:ribosomal-protein-alanine N-acetyltransferase